MNSLKQERNGGRRSRSRSPKAPGPCKGKKITLANLPFDFSWKKLKDLIRDELGFPGYVEIVESNGKSVGMALVEFRSVDDAQVALDKLHRYQIDDRKIIARETSERDRERIQQYRSGVNSEAMVDLMNYISEKLLERMGARTPITDSIHVSNIEFSVTWQKLKDIFRLCGTVNNCDVKTDSDGKSRGFAIVKFEHAFQAVQAVSMFNGQEFFNRALKIKIDREGRAPPQVPRHMLPDIELRAQYLLPFLFEQALSQRTRPVEGVSRALRLRRSPEGVRDVGPGFGNGGMPLRQPEDIAEWATETLKIAKARVEQLPPLRRMGLSGGHPGSRDDLYSGGNSSVNALDTLAIRDHADMLSRERLLRSRDLLDGPGAMNSLAASSRSALDTHRGRLNPPIGLPNISGKRGLLDDELPLPGRESSNYDSHTKSVVVHNLPFTYTWQDLVKTFNDVGEVRTAEIRMDENKRSKGFGFVHFFSPEAARRAVEEMNGVRFDGRNIKVELA